MANTGKNQGVQCVGCPLLLCVGCPLLFSTPLESVKAFTKSLKFFSLFISISLSLTAPKNVVLLEFRTSTRRLSLRLLV